MLGLQKHKPQQPISSKKHSSPTNREPLCTCARSRPASRESRGGRCLLSSNFSLVHVRFRPLHASYDICSGRQRGGEGTWPRSAAYKSAPSTGAGRHRASPTALAASLHLLGLRLASSTSTTTGRPPPCPPAADGDLRPRRGRRQGGRCLRAALPVVVAGGARRARRPLQRHHRGACPAKPSLSFTTLLILY